MSVSTTAALEAVLFATNHPLSLDEACEALEVSKDEVKKALAELARFYDENDRGIHLKELAGGWQFVTRSEMSPYVERMLVGRRRARLSRAGLETLAAVAYHQPITKGEIDSIRGVDCSGALRTLLDRELVTVKGRSDKVGHPLLYVTSPQFLEYFGLRAVEDLPQLDDFAALVDKEALLDEVTPEEEDEGSQGDTGDEAARDEQAPEAVYNGVPLSTNPPQWDDEQTAAISESAPVGDPPSATFIDDVEGNGSPSRDDGR